MADQEYKIQKEENESDYVSGHEVANRAILEELTVGTTVLISYFVPSLLCQHNENKKKSQYTTLYYCNRKKYKFRLYETAIIKASRFIDAAKTCSSLD